MGFLSISIIVKRGLRGTACRGLLMDSRGSGGASANRLRRGCCTRLDVVAADGEVPSLKSPGPVSGLEGNSMSTLETRRCLGHTQRC
jgi:hypothetical protein